MAHCHTNFHQMLILIPRHHFGKLEIEPGTGRKARSFTRWSQLVYLLSMQLSARVSLWDCVSSLKARHWPIRTEMMDDRFPEAKIRAVGTCVSNNDRVTSPIA